MSYDQTSHPMYQHFLHFREHAVRAGYQATERPDAPNIFWIHPKDGAEWMVRIRFDPAGGSLSAARLHAQAAIDHGEDTSGHWLQGPNACEIWRLDENGELAWRPFGEFLAEAITYAEAVLREGRANAAAADRKRALERQYAGGEGGAVTTQFGDGEFSQWAGEVFLNLKLRIPEDKVVRVLNALADVD